MPKRTSAYVYLLGANMLWGFASPILKFTLGALSPFTFLSYRFFLAAIFALFYIAIAKPKLPKKFSDYFYLLIYGFVSVPLALSFLFLGLKNSTVLELGLIGAIGPLLIVIGGAFFFKEKVSNYEKLGILIAVLGTLATILAPIFIGESGVSLSGNVLLLLFLLADSAGILMAKSFSKKYDPLLMVNFAFIIAAVVTIPFTFYLEGSEYIFSSLISLEFKYHLGVIYMAFLSGTLAYLLFLKGEKLIDAGQASLFFYLHPIFAFPLAIFWLGEKITPTFIVGAVTIAIGVYIAERKAKRRKAKHHPHKRLH